MFEGTLRYFTRVIERRVTRAGVRSFVWKGGGAVCAATLHCDAVKHRGGAASRSGALVSSQLVAPVGAGSLQGNDDAEPPPLLKSVWQGADQLLTRCGEFCSPEACRDFRLYKCLECPAIKGNLSPPKKTSSAPTQLHK